MNIFQCIFAKLTAPSVSPGTVDDNPDDLIDWHQQQIDDRSFENMPVTVVVYDHFHTDDYPLD